MEDTHIAIDIPKTIYYSERRDRLRHFLNSGSGDARRVKVVFDENNSVEDIVADVSPGGMVVMVLRKACLNSNQLMEVKSVDGDKAGTQTRARVRHWRPASERPDWMRIGISQVSIEIVEPINVDYWTVIPNVKFQIQSDHFAMLNNDTGIGDLNDQRTAGDSTKEANS